MSTTKNEALALAKKLGYEPDGQTGSGHLILHNPQTGHRYYAPHTPSDRRSWKNVLSDLQRHSGRKLPRQKSGKYRHLSPAPTFWEEAAALKRSLRRPIPSAASVEQNRRLTAEIVSIEREIRRAENYKKQPRVLGLADAQGLDKYSEFCRGLDEINSERRQRLTELKAARRLILP